MKKIGADLKDALRIAMSQPIIRIGTILFILVNFSSHLIMGNIIYYLTESFRLSPQGIGLTIGLCAIGSIIGAFLAPKFINKFLAGRLMIFCVGISTIGIAGLLLSSNIETFIFARALSMGAEAIIVVTMFTFRQKVIPQNYMSRTVAFTRTISYTPIPLAATLGGYILSHYGNMRIVFWISLTSQIICIILALFINFVRQRGHENLAL